MYCEGVRTRAQSQSEMMKYEINSYSNNDIVFFLYVQYLIFSNICDSIKIYTYSTCTLFLHVSIFINLSNTFTRSREKSTGVSKLL